MAESPTHLGAQKWQHLPTFTWAQQRRGYIKNRSKETLNILDLWNIILEEINCCSNTSESGQLFCSYFITNFLCFSTTFCVLSKISGQVPERPQNYDFWECSDSTPWFAASSESKAFANYWHQQNQSLMQSVGLWQIIEIENNLDWKGSLEVV